MRTATAKQTAFIARLVNERYEDQDIRDLFAARCADPSFTTREASEMIDQLLATPRPEPTPAPASAPVEPGVGGLDLSTVPSGRYAVEVDGVYKFFRIDGPTEGRWAGWRFVKIQASDELHRLGSQRPGSAYQGKMVDALRQVAADPRAASIAYGRELGVCGVCSRTLTDPESIAYGIGPVCREKTGW